MSGENSNRVPCVRRDVVGLIRRACHRFPLVYAIFVIGGAILLALVSGHDSHRPLALGVWLLQPLLAVPIGKVIFDARRRRILADLEHDPDPGDWLFLAWLLGSMAGGCAAVAVREWWPVTVVGWFTAQVCGSIIVHAAIFRREALKCAAAKGEESDGKR